MDDSYDSDDSFILKDIPPDFEHNDAMNNRNDVKLSSRVTVNLKPIEQVIHCEPFSKHKDFKFFSNATFSNNLDRIFPNL